MSIVNFLPVLKNAALFDFQMPWQAPIRKDPNICCDDIINYLKGAAKKS
jgi:hypothetical protein